MKLKIIKIILILCGTIPTALSQEFIDVEVLELLIQNKEKIINSVGISEPTNTVKLSSSNSGIIEEMLVDVGDQVKKGQLLAKIDSTSLKINLDSQNFTLQQSKSTYDKKIAFFETRFNPENSNSLEIKDLLAKFKWKKTPNFEENSAYFQQLFQSYQQSKINVDIAESNYLKDKKIYNKEIDIKQSLEQITQTNLITKLAKQHLDRNIKLLQRGIISQSDFDTIKNKHNLAVSNEELANLNHSTLLETRRSKLINSKKQWELTLNQNKLSQINLGNSLINFNTEVQNAYYDYKREQQNYKRSLQFYNLSILKAPFDGLVQTRHYSKNESANKYTPVFEIVNLGKISVIINVNEQNINDFKKGARATVSFDNIIQKKFQGIVTKIGVNVIDNSRTYEVEIEIENPNQQIKFGSNARVEYSIKQFKNELFIPLSSIIEKNNKQIVFIAKANIAEEVEITTGEIINDQILVTSGLKAGDKIVIKGQQFITAGIAINVTNNL